MHSIFISDYQSLILTCSSFRCSSSAWARFVLFCICRCVGFDMPALLVQYLILENNSAKLFVSMKLWTLILHCAVQHHDTCVQDNDRGKLAPCKYKGSYSMKSIHLNFAKVIHTRTKITWIQSILMYSKVLVYVFT
jgi:hypothetical protein